MSPQQDMNEKSRRTRHTLYFVASIYVGAGFFVTIPAAVAGNTMTAFLGFLVVSGALAVTAIVNSLLQLGSRVGAMEEKLETFHELQKSLNLSARTPTVGTGTGALEDSTSAPDMLDLTSSGVGDLSDLAAATLEREVFPRLVSTMDDVVSTATGFRVESSESLGDHVNSEVGEDSVHDHSADGRNGSAEGSTKNVMLSWAAARRAGDLSACRIIFDKVVDTGDTDLVEHMQEQLADMNQSAKAALREKFANHVRAGELTCAIETGERLRELFPDSELAAEFVQLKPLLIKRLGTKAANL